MRHGERSVPMRAFGGIFRFNGTRQTQRGGADRGFVGHSMFDRVFSVPCSVPPCLRGEKLYGRNTALMPRPFSRSVITACHFSRRSRCVISFSTGRMPEESMRITVSHAVH